MATFVNGYISDLSPVKDNIKLCVRILRAWLQPLYNNQKVKNMKMIVMDEHNTKMQATVRMDKLNRFKIKPKFRMVYNAMRLSFLSNTKVDACTDFNGSVHDVVGQVIACEELDNYDKNGKAEKKTSHTH
ncbi:replication protein A 70 kDa DNA-binding subunit B [Tanacetum coccineum]